LYFVRWHSVGVWQLAAYRDESPVTRRFRAAGDRHRYESGMETLPQSHDQIVAA